MRSDPHPAPPRCRPTLVVDVGTSWTKLALVTAGRLVRLDAVRSGDGRDDGDARGEQWEARLESSLTRHGLDLGDIDRLAVSSVVPHVTARLRAAERNQGSLPVRFVSPYSAPLPIDYHPLGDLGPDRIANAVAALERWGAPVVIIDVGTATTCDLVSADRRFVGGAIAPGPWVGYQGLVVRAPHLVPGAVLAATDGDTPLAGTSTVDCLRVGVLRGAAALVDGLTRGYHRIVGPCPVVATGGLAPAVARLSDTITALDADLTLWGVHLSCGPAPVPQSPPTTSTGRR